MDLAALVKAGLLSPNGERRGRYYLASERLEKIQVETRLPRQSLDPFEEVERKGRSEQQDLLGLTATPAEAVRAANRFSLWRVFGETRGRLVGSGRFLRRPRDE